MNYKKLYKVGDKVFLVPCSMFGNDSKGFCVNVSYVGTNKLILVNNDGFEYKFNKNGYVNYCWGITYRIYKSEEEYRQKRINEQIKCDIVEYIKRNLNKLNEEQLLNITDVIEEK